MRPKPHIDVRLLKPLEHGLAIFHRESKERRFRPRRRDRFEAKSWHFLAQTLEQRLAMGLDALDAQLQDVRQRRAERRHRSVGVAADFKGRASVGSQFPGKWRA